MNTADTNAIRNTVNLAIGCARSGEEELGTEEFDVALDHLRIARETIARAETAIRTMLAEAEEAYEAALAEGERAVDQILNYREETGL